MQFMYKNYNILLLILICGFFSSCGRAYFPIELKTKPRNERLSGQEKQDIEFVSKYSNKTFLKKMATPKDIAAPCVFLVSDHANYITSEVLVVDGGYCNS